MITQLRQGDVLLIARQEPKAYTRVDARGLRVEGERTGHVHVLEAEVYETSAGRFLYLPEGGMLRHVTQEGTQADHAPISVAPGWWEPRIQREFVPQGRPRGRFD